MAGKRIVPASILLLVSALLLLFLAPGSGVQAHDWDTNYTLIVSDTVPGANADVKTIFQAGVPPSPVKDNNFAQIISATGYPEAQIALDSEIPDGSDVGKATNATTLSLYNSMCNNPITVTVPFMDCTTDIYNTEPWVGSGDNLVLDCNRDRNEDGSIASEYPPAGSPDEAYCRDGIDNDGDGLFDFDDPDCIGNCIDTSDNDGNGDPDCADPQCLDDSEDTNGLPTYCDHYPAFLNEIFQNIRPRARYEGHQVVVGKAPATMLDFVVFNPESLAALPGVEGTMGDTFGFIDFVVLDNPLAPASPSTITDFCLPLTAIPDLWGLSDGQWQVMPGPEPYEVDRTGQCADALDNDNDGWVNDGCFYKPDPCDGIDNDSDGLIDEGCDYVRNQLPPAHTGLFGTGTHVVRTYTHSNRDADTDGISNNLDSCPLIANTYIGCPSGDCDGDGINEACDLELIWHGPGPEPLCYNNGIPDDCPSPNAIPPNNKDDDGDGLIDEDWVDNADNDGDGLVDEDGECKGTSGLPDEDQDCYPNRQDLCPFVPDDQTDLDTAPGQAPDAGPATDAIGAACEPNVSGVATPYDNDGDTVANEDPMDGVDNDGDCAAQAWGDTNLDGVVCGQGDRYVDEDPPDDWNGDGVADVIRPDMAPGENPATQCNDNVDDDGDTVADDGCETDRDFPNGHYHAAMVNSYVCIPDQYGADDKDGDGDSDDDGDGVCDSTEDLLGSVPRTIPEGGTEHGVTPAGVPACSDGIDNDADTFIDSADAGCSQPEHLALDLAIGTGTPAQAPGTCSDYDVYNHPDSGAIDNDGDGLINAGEGDVYGNCADTVDNDGDTLIDAADPQCADGEDPGCAPIAGDADDDGVPDDVDNCPAEKNQEQVDSDSDTIGDECDDDDDNDGFTDRVEDLIGTDPKDNCTDHPNDNAWPVDIDNDQECDIADVMKFKPVILTLVGPGTARFDLDADGEIDIADVMKFKPHILKVCATPLIFHNDTTEPVNDIYIEFFAEITHVPVAVDTAGGIWTCERVPPLCANDVDDDGDTLVNDGCRPLFGGGEGPTGAECENDVDDDGDTKVNDGCEAVGPDDDGDTLPDPEDRYTGGITYVHDSPSYKLNCRRDSGYMSPSNILLIGLKGKRPPEVRCYDWTADCVVINSSSKPCRFHNTTLQPVDNLYVEFGRDDDGDTVSDRPGRSWCDNLRLVPPGRLFGPIGEYITSLYFPHAIAAVDILFPIPLEPSQNAQAHWQRPGPWTLQCWAWTDTTLTEGPGAGPCNNGIDDDGDTYIDSADPDCWVGPSHGECKYNPALSEDEAGPNTCGDGDDNGGDGVADLEDPDCFNP